MTDWADEKAGEWLEANVPLTGTTWREKSGTPSLAALLREVAKDKQYEQWQADQHVTAEILGELKPDQPDPSVVAPPFVPLRRT